MTSHHRANCLLIPVVFIILFYGLMYDTQHRPDPVDCADGSRIVYGNGPTYEHHLCQGFILSHTDRTLFSDVLSGTQNNPFQGETKDHFAYYATYAVDQTGYIAYYRLPEHNPVTDDLNQRMIMIQGRKIDVGKCGFFLYDIAAGTEKKFSDRNALTDHCKMNNIHLGAWYYGGGDRPDAEACLLQTGGVTVMSAWKPVVCVRYQDRELFVGEIKRYAEDDAHLYFHLNAEYDETKWFPALWNTNITVDEDTPVDLYVAVSLSDGTYQTFQDKNALKDAHDLSGLSWKKLRWN